MQVFNVSGMTCGHCVKAVTAAIQVLDAEAQVRVDLARKEVQVQSTLTTDAVQAAIAEEGYEVSLAG